MTELVALQRLLDRADLAGLLAAFAAPQAGLAVFRADGRLFASAGQWARPDLDALAGRVGGWAANGRLPALDDDRYHAYPLRVGPLEQPAALLVVRPDPAAPNSQLETALCRALLGLLELALARREVANETIDRYREINLLYRMGETIGAQLDPAPIPGMVLAESHHVIDAGAGLVLLGDVDHDGRWDVYATSGLPELAEALQGLAATVVDAVARTGRAAIITDLPAGTAYGALLAAPLKARDNTLGCIVLGRAAGRPVFTASDEKMLSALAGQAAIAMENARLHQAALEKERLERELQLAFGVQASLLPRTVPQLPGWDFAAYWQPAREVSGDFYDFITHDPARQGVVIADVADKGMPAALFMALTRSIVRASTAAGRTPAASLTQANRLLCPDALNGMFVTVFYAELNPASGALTYVNGGHNPPMHYRRATDDIVELGATGIMLGFDDTWPFEQQTTALEAGDFIIFFTDGVTEAVSPDPQGGRFEEERLRQLLLDHRHASADEMVQALRTALDAFTAGRPPVDDITVVIARRLA
jgi:serine phosphatase RsbU (regulator of sigma subunit)